MLHSSVGSMGSAGFGALASSRSPIRPVPSYPIGAFDALSQLDVLSSRPGSAANTPMRSQGASASMPPTPTAQSPAAASTLSHAAAHTKPPLFSPVQSPVAPIRNTASDGSGSLSSSDGTQHAAPASSASQGDPVSSGDAASQPQTAAGQHPPLSNSAASHTQSLLDGGSSAVQPTHGRDQTADPPNTSPFRNPAQNLQPRSSATESQPGTDPSKPALHSASSSGAGTVSGSPLAGSKVEAKQMPLPGPRIRGTTDPELRALAALSQGGRIASGAEPSMSFVPSPSRPAAEAPTASLSDCQWAGLVTSPPSSPDPIQSLHPPQVPHHAAYLPLPGSDCTCLSCTASDQLCIADSWQHTASARRIK